MNAGDWLSSNLGVPLSDGQRRCAQALWDMTRIYNIPSVVHERHSVQLLGDYGLSILHQGELGTYDSADLTRLVLAAHRHRVRVTVRAWRPWGCPEDEEARLTAIAEYLKAEVGVDLDPECEEDVEQMAAGVMEITLTARGLSKNYWEHHPSLEDLVANTDQVDPT